MRMYRSRNKRLALAGVAAFACAQVGATGLQVAPTTLTLAAERNADGLWLSNTGAERLHAQVRVYAWTQEGGADHLVPSHALAISPPMLQLEPGARQLVRVIRVGTPPARDEAAYRILVDELPVDVPATAQAPVVATSGTALKFVLRYSVPVFVAPAKTVVPELHGQLAREGETSFLTVRNAGSAHAQLASVEFVDAQGRREELVPGLLGYVLPGQTMRWPLALSPAALAQGGNLQSRINGEAAEHILAPIPPAR
jgi:fimbrial chaperone protein